MWKLQLTGRGLDSVEGYAGAAIIFTSFAQQLSSQHVESELCSDTLCWILLPLLFKWRKQRDGHCIPISHNERRYPTSSTLWVAAICLIITSCYKAEIGVVGLFPALTPLYFVIEKRLNSGWHALNDRTSFPAQPVVWGSALAAAFAILILSEWKLNLQGLFLSIILVMALLIVYVVLTPRLNTGSYSFVNLDFEADIAPLSQRVVPILVLSMAMQAFVFGIPHIEILPTVFLGFSKTFSWFFISRTTQHTSWAIPTIITTFSILSTQDPFTQSSEFQAFSHVVGSFITLAQIIYMLKKHAKAHSILWCLALFSFVPYFANLYAIHESSINIGLARQQKHPVESLMWEAGHQFDNMLQRQSRDVESAIREYKSRYKIDPPPGFDTWFEYAKENQSPIVDDFDLIFDRISPFLKLSGTEFVTAMKDVQNTPGSDVWCCSFSSATSETRCKHPHRSSDRNYQYLFNSLLVNLRSIPDVKFLVNHFDEPRVFIPPSSPSTNNSTHPNITKMSRNSTWDTLTMFCPSPEKLTTSFKPNNAIETIGLPFVTNLSSSKDLCQQPEYKNMHGLAMSPTSFLPIKGLVPILSTSSLSTMGDILLPSPAYLETEFQYDESNDINWENKRNNLYWAGSTTGGFAQDSKWTHFHRQRLVNFAQNKPRGQQYSYLRQKDGITTVVKSSFLNSRLYNVFFTKITQCAFPQCRAQRLSFNPKPRVHRDDPFKSRLVFDLDGNGISGRYYKLLASKSLPLKQTILKEWHDERLVPWLHYVPVSLGMEELPELVEYLTSTAEGRERAKEMAEEGRAWFQKSMREVDRSVYVYRLLLELARLQDPRREAG